MKEQYPGMDQDAHELPAEISGRMQKRVGLNSELALKAMLRLNPVLRSAFLLHKREGLTHREMADELGISVETAKSRVFRARRQLREELEALTS